MDEELRTAFETLAERGRPVGAEAAVARAVAEAEGVELAPLARRRRPRGLRVGAAVAAASVVLFVALAGAGLLYARAKLGDIERIDLHAELAGSAAPSEPMTILVVGSDSRAGLGAADEERFGDEEAVGAARADTVMVLRLDPGAGTVTALSLPRDLWVQIAGTGKPQRINTALGFGAGVVVETVQAVLGIELDHYVQVDFDGFRRMVDAVGGVTMRFDAPVRDQTTGLLVPTAGCHELDGDEALALVRSRHEQRLVGDRWRTDPTGDLGRIARQQRFLLAVLADVGGTRSPVTMARLLEVAADEITVDSALTAGDLLDLGRRVGAFEDIRFVPVPTSPARIGAQSVLTASPEDLLAAGAALLAPGPSGPAAPGSSATLPPPVPASPPDACH